MLCVAEKHSLKQEIVRDKIREWQEVAHLRLQLKLGLFWILSSRVGKHETVLSLQGRFALCCMYGAFDGNRLIEERSF